MEASTKIAEVIEKFNKQLHEVEQHYKEPVNGQFWSGDGKQ